MTPSRKRRRTSNEDVQPADSGHEEDGPPVKKQQQRRSVFVRSLAPTTTTESLISHFSQSFPIKHATAVTDPETQSCRGYGFITFADADDALRAIQEFNGSDLQGRKIKLEIAEPRHRDIDDTLPNEVTGELRHKSKPSAAAAEAKAKRDLERSEARKPPKLIVRNLPWSIKKPEQLALLFRSYGKVKHATIPSKKPGLMAGFGFVVLRGHKNAEKALQGVNGKEIDGRTLAVDWAVEKDVWEEQQKEDGLETDGGQIDANKKDVESDNGDVDDAELSADQGGEEDELDEENVEDEYRDEDDEDPTEHEKPAQDYSTTLFIRNLPFQCTDESLQQRFSEFGRVRYARIVFDRNTELPKGTGFVCFFSAEDARLCLRNAPGAAKLSTRSKNTQSILQSELDDPSGKYTIEGRILQVSKAVDRSEAARLTEEGISYRGERDKDKRRLYLLSEGTISSKSPLYQKLSPAEIAMRDASLKQRKTLIQSNPSLHLSLTRLSVRNIPRSVNSADLKALAREAVVGFAKDVKDGKRERLSKEELARWGDAMVEAEKLRKRRGIGIVKQTKVVFEGREGSKVTEGSGAGRSRGYGFIEYHSHRSALMGLRWLNGHALDYKVKETEKGSLSREELTDRKKRLIVEFAIENAQVVKRRIEREHKAREKPQAEGQHQPNGVEDEGDALFNVVQTTKTSAGANKKTRASTEQTKNSTEDGNKQAKRQRIIAKKRATRRGRREAGKAS